MEWRPIDTAPKDQPIDLWVRHRGRVTNCEWGETVAKNKHPGNEVWLGNGLKRDLIDPSDATHWMPLPSPPQEKEAEK